MRTDFDLPLALCKAQYGMWLHALELFETSGLRALQNGIALTRAEADAVLRAEDWQALAAASMHAFRCRDADGVSHAPPALAAAQTRAIKAPPSRQAVVDDALQALHRALTAAPSARRLHAGRKTAAVRGKM